MEKQTVNTEALIKHRAKIMMEIQFVGFISDLTNTGLQYLGRLKNPRTNQFVKNIEQAERMIYLLDMLAEKTKANLTPMENEHLKTSTDRLKRIFFEETQLDRPAEKKQVISIRHILLDSESHAEDVLKEIKSGADFAELAKLHSQCNSRADGGYIDGIKHGDFPQAVEDAAFSLEKDQTSGIVASVMGYHIIKLIDKNEQTNNS